MIDLYLRCFSRARWLTFAANRNIIDAQGAVNPNFSVDELGNIVITPAVMDGMTVVTPAVLDTWWSVNVRLTGPRFTADVDTLYTGETDPVDPTAYRYKFIRSKLVRFIREQATLVMVQGRRTYQFGTTTNRIQLLDPRDITTPKRVWLGGNQV